jgi:cell division protein FtsZ
MEDRKYTFEPRPNTESIIKVIGVGGGGSNAVNHMFSQGIHDVDFVVCNTDRQALDASPVANKIQIGTSLTEGLGAGANPERGREAAVESEEAIRKLFTGKTKMVFITAGMGGGTGTGAAPEIARMAKESGVLTVGIVTMPFKFEGPRKMMQAKKGIEELRENCDTVLTILNDRLSDMYSNLSVSNAFSKADDILTIAAKGIAEIITLPGHINVDFEDVKTVMLDAGAAVMGSAVADGENRALRAAEAAISSPLLNNRNILGAQKILLSIRSSRDNELQMDELNEITEYIQEQSGDEAIVIFGNAVDDNLSEGVGITLIATGFQEDANKDQHTVYDLESRNKKNHEAQPAPPAVDKMEETEAEKPENSYSDNEESAAQEEEEDSLNQRIVQLQQAARSRVEKLRLENTYLSNREHIIDEGLKAPAYMRKRVKFQRVPSSREENVSRYSLDERGHLDENNRFLHDNVD